MPVARFYSSTAQPTTLAGGISGGSATMTVAATTGFPASFPYTLAVDYGSAGEELVEVTGAAGVVLNITRGVDGTSAQSHGGGAVVRHVISARDFADFQAHQAATSDVHGVTGALVGASSTQTLANKTLTSPTINSGALSGTFSGNPTFSGTPVFNAGGSLTGTFTGSPTLSGNPIFSGAPQFTGGALFQRGAANTLAQRTSVTADSQDRHQVQADGKHLWGPGSGSLDTTLYRSGAGTLTTDGAMSVGGALSAGNFTAGAWGTWTPVWSTASGLHTPSYGGATVVATYFKLGRGLFYSIAITFVAGTNFGSGVTTADNWLFSLPATFAASANFTSKQTLAGIGRASASNALSVPISARIHDTGTDFIVDVAGGPASGTLSNSGSIDSVTPWTWASTNIIAWSGFVECTS